MPSPFPGMNPFLEAEGVWQDFHYAFILATREFLNRQIRPAYFAWVEEALFIHELGAQERQFLGRADVGVVETGNVADARRPVGAAVQAPAYGQLPAAVDVERHPFLEIRDRQNQALVTVIELLSPSNKNPGPDRDQYVGKRRQLFASGAHVVEIDLLRGGPRLPLEGLPDGDYYALVSRYEDRPRVGIWPLRLRDPLPTIPIPLRDPDPDATLDLKAVLDRVYDAAGYESVIYARPPQPPLSPADAEWAGQLVPRR